MQYVIDLHLPETKTVPCTIQPSTASPGKFLCVLENGKTVCVEPDGSHSRDIDAGADNWDSPWTWASRIGDKLVYRSANQDSKGEPRTFLVIE
jgi:hypothetical protein